MAPIVASWPSNAQTVEWPKRDPPLLDLRSGNQRLRPALRSGGNDAWYSALRPRRRTISKHGAAVCGDRKRHAVSWDNRCAEGDSVRAGCPRDAPDESGATGEPMKVREAIRMIEQDGWRLVNQEGSHRQYKHPEKKGRVTIAGHTSMDLDPKTQNSILKQAGLK